MINSELLEVFKDYLIVREDREGWESLELTQNASKEAAKAFEQFIEILKEADQKGLVI